MVLTRHSGFVGGNDCPGAVGRPEPGPGLEGIQPRRRNLLSLRRRRKSAQRRPAIAIYTVVLTFSSGCF